MSNETPRAKTVQAVVCPTCSTLNPENAKFCSNCGEKFNVAENTMNSNSVVDELSAPAVTEAASEMKEEGSASNQAQDPTTPSPELQANAGSTDFKTDPDFQALLGEKNKTYYLGKFADIETSGKEISFNWSAFFFGVFWGIYRRLYIQAGICFALALIAVILPELTYLISMAISITWGLFGNFWYKNSLEEKCQKAKTLSDPTKSQFISSNSGTLF